MRLIDADELKKVPLFNGGHDAKNADPHFISGIRSVMEYIDNMPIVDAVEVVRCKDCKHKLIFRDGRIYCEVNCVYVHSWLQFCSEGVRQNATD